MIPLEAIVTWTEDDAFESKLQRQFIKFFEHIITVGAQKWKLKTFDGDYAWLSYYQIAPFICTQLNCTNTLSTAKPVYFLFELKLIALTFY